MLKTDCINPVILSALALGGHGDKALIAGGNYPVEKLCPGVPTAYVGLRPGLPDTVEVLGLIKELIAVERVEVMLEPDAASPEIFSEYRAELGGMELDVLDKQAFYAAAGQARVCLAVATGDVRPWANLLLTIGVIRPCAQKS